MTDETPSSVLGIPPQTRAGAGAFDPREKYVANWTAGLPRGNIGECAKQLFSALRETNRTVIEERTRFKMLELFRESASQIEQALKKHFVNQSLPLSAKNRVIATLARELNTEFAIGYKILVEQEIVLGGSRLNDKLQAMAIHRAMRYLGNLLLTCFQTYEPYPAGTWNHIHRLYVFAEQGRLENTLIKDHPLAGEVHDCSIRDLYKQIVLLGAAEPYRLRQPVTELVNYQLEKWVSYCRVLPGNTPVETAAACLLVNLDSDHAPMHFFNTKPQDNPELHRFIDTGALVAYLEKQLGTASRGKNFNGEQLNKPSADTLKRLIDAWSGKSRRLYTRVPCGGRVSLSVGLNATHRHIRKHLEKQDDHELLFCAEAHAALDRLFVGVAYQSGPDEETVLEVRSHYHSAPVFGVSQLDDHTPDVWEANFSYNAPTNHQVDLNRNSPKTAAENPAQPLKCVCVNESADGYCIVGLDQQSGNTEQRVRIGELVGIHYDAEEMENELSIGVIRRIRHSQDSLELGIQKLAPCAATVATAPIKTPQNWEQFSRSLYLPEVPAIKRAATLITHAWHSSGDHLTLNHHGRRIQVSLTNIVETTGIFTQFEFEVIKKRTPEKGPSNPALQKDRGDFDDVWSLI